MNEIKLFEKKEFGAIRTVEIDGQVYFFATDVAKALGYANPHDAIIKHCRWVAKREVPHPQSPAKTLEVNVIPKGDIVRLAAQSELPGAEKFESWIFDEVIPSVLDNGGYIAGQEQMTPEQIVANALIVANNIIANKDKQIEEMKPKAEYFDELVERNLLTSFRVTANEFGIKESVLINWLIDKKYIYRDQKNKLRAYADKNNGLFETKEYKSRHSDHAGTQTLITPKGRETFRILMKI